MSEGDLSIAAILEALDRYDKPGPRYTSYPTAVEFDESFGEEDYRVALRAANARSDAPLSVYNHLPFCEQRCHYCGCHVIVSPRKEIVHPYLEHLIQEVKLVAAELSDRKGVAQFHLGGGTPTYFSPEQLKQLVDAFEEHFEFLPGAELAIEVDPRVTTNAHIDVLAGKGFNRISMGVQDFTPEVQEAVNRVQSPEQTEALAGYARECGLVNLNIDLIYGLPHQQESTFAETLDRVIALRPDRVAVYSFAYVPWTKGTQKRIDEEALPKRDEKFALYALARTKFMSAGYQAIGMDHFALPTDELSIAQQEGRLYRNFMGYTVMPGEDALGFGVSAIGDVQGSFIQNEKKLSTYYKALDEGHLPVNKGFRRNADDEVRRDLIQQLMCNFRVRRSEIEAKHGIDFDSYFASDLDRLSAWQEEGLVEITPDELQVTETGKLFVRNLAMCFDTYLERHESSGKPVFSRTV